MIKRVTVRNILLISILAIVGVLSFVISRRFQAPVIEKVVEALPQDVDLALKTVSYTETRGGEKLWTLSADSVDHVSGQGQTTLANVRMVFYSLGEFGDVTMTADKGYWFQQEGRIDLEGNVEAQGSRGHAFYTQQLTYLHKEGLARTELPVKMVGQGMEITGTGLSLDINTHQIKLLSQVRGKLHGG